MACGLALALLATGEDAASDAAPVSAGAIERVEITPSVAQYRLAAEMMLGNRKQAYPDPREGMMALRLALLADPIADAEAEAQLELSRGMRREIQLRLRLAEHDPKGIDGVFGPATRGAIAAWQERASIPSTGYVTARTLDRLLAVTDNAYQAWQDAKDARRHREQRMAAAAPVRRPERYDCKRLRSGEIAYGRNIRCDVKGLRENLSSVGETLTKFFVGAETLRPTTLHGIRAEYR